MPTSSAKSKKSSIMTEYRDHLAARREAMLASLRELVELESPSHNKQAVDRLGEALAGKFGAIGGEAQFHRSLNFGDHLQVDFAGRDPDRKPIMLLGHFDTVWDVDTLKQMPFKIEGEKAFGPGIFDMKGGIVMMLEAIRAVRELRGGLPRPVTVLLNTDEEVGSDSSRPITEGLARHAEAVLVLEPSGPGGAAKTARKGVGDYTVRVTGVPSHAGLDFEKGQSAIVELARQVLQITRFVDLKRGLTVNPGVIRGGTRTNVVAAAAEVDVDVRIAKMADAKGLDKKFRALRPFNKKCKVEVAGGINRPPLEKTEASAALFETAGGLARQIGWKLREVAVGGGSDGNFTAGLGIPTLDGLGAAGDGAHAKHEHVLIGELPRKAALIAALLEKI
jgi:glutamate carboxypeptidase